MTDNCESCGRPGLVTMHRIPAYQSSTGSAYSIRLCHVCRMLPIPSEDHRD